MTSADDIARAVGAPLLHTTVVGDRGADTRDVFLAEPYLSAVGEPGDLVLAVGVAEPADAVDLVRRCADAGASGLVARTGLAEHPQVVAAAEATDLALIAAGEGISWAHLVWLLRGVIDRTAVPGPSAPSGVHNDLFALADTVAAVVGAPVTIEDSKSRVLAYSSGQSRTDTARVATIVGRRVPEEVAAHFRALGVFRRLARSDEPFLVPEGPDGTRPRLVVPVRAGGEWLGSIWAVVEGPVDDAVAGDLRKAASVLALHLLRLRAQSDVARRSAAGLLRSALWQYAPEKSAKLDLPGSGPWRVVALRAPAGYDDTGEQLRLWETLTQRHGWPDACLADLEDTVFMVVGEGSAPGSWNWVQRLVTEAHQADGSEWAAAAGTPVSVAELPRSRAEAVELLALLETRQTDPGVAGQRVTGPRVPGRHIAGPRVPGPVSAAETAWPALTIHRMARAVDVDLLGGPVSSLVAHDAAHQTEYVATLRMWLRHHGEPSLAAGELMIHPNTLRYRMRRMHDVLRESGPIAMELDLNNPEQRLALQVQIEAATIQG